MLYSFELPYGASRSSALSHCISVGFIPDFDFASRWPIKNDKFRLLWGDDTVILTFIKEIVNEVGEVFFVLESAVTLTAFESEGILCRDLPSQSC